jgi:glycosyltransferase involved in cell wall biosynthesis
MELKISIALATYNGSKHIEAQLQSMSSQTTLPDELVVSDDGSTDDTIAIIKRFAQTAPFEITVLPKHKRLGFADNFFHAAAACRNDIIAFTDQDDVWSDKKLEMGLAPFVDSEVLLSMHTLTMTDGLLNPIGLHRQGIDQDKVYPPLQLNPFATGWGNSMVFRKSLLEIWPASRRPKQPSGNRPLSHDTWIYTLAAALGAVAHIDTPLVLYRQHDLNTMGMGKSPFKEKISGALTASVGRYLEVADFYASMFWIFEQIASNPGPFSEMAASARDVYRARMQSSKARVDTYTADSLKDRAFSYYDLYFSKDGKLRCPSDVSYLSMTKDALIGILKLGYRRESRD